MKFVPMLNRNAEGTYMTNTRSLLRWGLVGGVVGAISLAASASQAQVNVYNGGGLNIDVGVTAAVFYATTRNTYFGAGGNFGYTSINGGEADVTWSEAFVEPTAYMSYDDVGGGQVYGGASLLATAMRGDGEPTGGQIAHAEDIDMETAYIGWTGSMGDMGVDVSYGRQDVSIGTEFLIGYGGFTDNDDGHYWLGAKKAFERAGRLSLEGLYLDGLRADVVYLESNQSQADTDMGLINLEYHVDDLGHLSFLYGTVLHSDNAGDGPATLTANGNSRVDLDIMSFGMHGNPIASMMPNWFFAFEYVGEQKGGSAAALLNTGVADPEVDAEAYYVDVGYAFVDWPWAPSATLRHLNFSGDDPNTAEDEAYDAMFYGFTNWGTWFVGEVTGEYILFNSNFNVNMLMVQAAPYDNLFVTASYFDFTINEPGAGVDDDFGQELNLIADWAVNDNMAVSVVYGILEPGGNAEATFGGNDDNFQVAAVGAWVWF